MEESDFTKKTYFVLLFLAIVLVGVLCKILSSVVLPIVISILLSLVLMPIVQKLNSKLKIPWSLASVIIVILFFFAFLAFSSILVSSLTKIFSEYPKYESKFLYIYRLIANQFDLEFDEDKSFIGNMWTHLQVREFTQKAALFLSSGIFAFGKNLLVVALMLCFLLSELRFTRQKINHAFFGKAKGKILRISTSIVTETTRYLSIKFFISLATGVIVFLGCLIIGLDFPIVWGFFAFIMNFIPTFGSIISTVVTTLFAFVEFYPTYWQTIFVFILLLSVNMILGNIVEPRIEGKHLGLSPFAILASLSLWGYIWGFIGMLLAVPITVILKIFCESISYLHVIAVILGGNPETSESKASVIKNKILNRIDKNKTNTINSIIDTEDVETDKSENLDE